MSSSKDHDVSSAAVARSASPSSRSDAVMIDRDDIIDFNEANILPESAESQAEILAWLQPTAYDSEDGEYRRHLRSHLIGTGEWIRSSSTFQKWRTSPDDGMIWVKGIPGSGKSVVAATIAHGLATEAPVLYFFFRQIIDANHTPIALLRDWLAQMLPYSPPLQVELRSLVDKRTILESLSMAQLWEYLKSALVQLPQAFCVVDALDEMNSGNDMFLTALAEFGQWRPANVKVLVTSRPVASVERALRQKPMLQIRLEEQFVDTDIARYVNAELERSRIPDEKRDAVRQAVPGQANGLFLYAKLAMDAFLEDNADIDSVLAKLPADLNAMYTSLLREHARRSGVSAHLQYLILSWVTHASRPLRLLELAEMIRATQKTGLSLSDLKNKVRAACGPLLEILPNETICVIHHSLTEFLRGSTRCQSSPTDDECPVLYPEPTHDRLAVTCILYLLSGPKNTVDQLSINSFRSATSQGTSARNTSPCGTAELHRLAGEYPFLAYSAENWYIHARKAGTSDKLFECIGEVFSDTNLPSMLALAKERVSGSTSMHLVAKLGLTQYAARYLEQSEHVDIDIANSLGETPLLYAAANGHTEILKLLLAHGARPDEPSGYDGLKPLHLAVNGDHADMVDLLLSAGVDPMTEKTKEDPGYWCRNAPPTVGHTPLQYAFMHGHEDAARKFLPYLTDAKVVSQALAYAGLGDHLALLKDVLRHSLIDIDAEIMGDTPLNLAARNGSWNCVLALLEARAQANGKTLDAFCDPALWQLQSDVRHTYSAELALSCILAMINAGVDINAKDKEGNTALTRAVFSKDITRALIRAGADVKRDMDYLLCDYDDPEILEILLNEGKPNLNLANSDDGCTPLLTYASRLCAKESILRLLLDHGSDISATDREGKSALHLSVRRYVGSRTLELLLQAGLSPNLQDNAGKTPMHYLTHRTLTLPVAQQLISAGADFTVQDHQGRTPLYCMMERGWDHTLFVEVLDQVWLPKCDLDVVDFQGRNFLFACLYIPNFPLLRYLIGKGLDIGSIDHQGNTLWHALIEVQALKTSAHTDLREEPPLDLFELGLNADQANSSGQTPLHYLCAHSRFWVPLIPLVKNADARDHQGVRPLHLAARASEEHVAALLEAGASPTEPTNEGFTPLHVAARFGRSNVVGLLLEAIKTQDGPQGLEAHLNRVHGMNCPSALDLACRSGRPETVSQLLAAGAKPRNLPIPSLAGPKGEVSTKSLPSATAVSTLAWCAQHKKREDFSRAPEGLWTCGLRKSSGSVKNDIMAHGTHRGRPLYTCLNEVLRLLYTHGVDIDQSKDQDGRTCLDQVLLDTTFEKGDYAVDCLLTLRQRLDIAGNDGDTSSLKDARFDAISEMQLEPDIADWTLRHYASEPIAKLERLLGAVLRRAASREALARAQARKLREGEKLEEIQEDILMRMDTGHEWSDMALDIQGADSKFVHQSLQCLVSLGLVYIFRSWVNRGIFTEDIRAVETNIKDKEVSNKSEDVKQEALLVLACRRRYGNLPIMRILVETLQVDVNARTSKKDSALCALVDECSWWQVTQGLPYLLDQGADTELRGRENCTPLQLVLMSGSPFSLRAAQTLINAGANVNAGNTCLQLASNNVELTKLLVAGGAVVTAKALFAACKKKNTGVLEALLSAGADANMRRAPLIRDYIPTPCWGNRYTSSHEYYPIYWAASQISGYSSLGTGPNTRKFRAQHIPIIQTLLKHGADPFARFFKTYPAGYGERDSNGSTYECTVLHELLMDGDLTLPLLETELNLEHRDPKGRTVLLAACRSSLGPDSSIDAVKEAENTRNADTLEPAAERLYTDKRSFVDFLLDRGACATARDAEGRNALHHILEADDKGGHKSLERIIAAAPELVGHIDALGNTPLHYALRRCNCRSGMPDSKAIRLLLGAGADPFVPDKEGNTALHLAARFLGASGSPEEPDAPRTIFQQLLSLGLPINSRNAQGETAAFVFVAAQCQRDSSMAESRTAADQLGLDVLVAAGADFAVMDKDGSTLLHVVAGMPGLNSSASSNHDGQATVQLFQSLVKFGLDLGAEDNKHQTCLDVAAAHGNDKLLKLYERKG